MVKQRARTALLLMTVAAAGLGGCPQGSTGDASAPTDVVVEASTQSAAVGGQVSLTARSLDESALAGVTYRWYQTYGRVVELANDQASEATFTAPSLPTDQVLRFRVDVKFADGQTRSAEIEIAVAADPQHSLGGSDDSGSPDDPFPQVRIKTSKGTILVELDRDAAPLTVNNFLRYVDDGFYNETIFHRVIPEFVIQGGGYTSDLVLKETRPAILNESDNGLRNLRGTIAMARTNDPDSATSQFFINLVDNPTLDATDGANGYAVFGRVIEGIDVVDDIAEVETGTRGGLSDVPVNDILINEISRVEAQSGSPKPRQPASEEL